MRGPSADTAVFGINFIRRAQAPVRLRLAVIYVVAGYLLISATLTFALLGMSWAASRQAAHLRALPSIAPLSREAVQALEQDIAALSGRAQEQLARLTGVIELQRQRFPVAGKLAALTNTLPARAWITAVSGGYEQRAVRVEAAYLIDPEHLDTPPMKGWVEALWADPIFGRGLKRLEIGASSRKRSGQAELLVFALEAQW